jgi:hypothetical protein
MDRRLNGIFYKQLIVSFGILMFYGIIRLGRIKVGHNMSEMLRLPVSVIGQRLMRPKGPRLLDAMTSLMYTSRISRNTFTIFDNAWQHSCDHARYRYCRRTWFRWKRCVVF